MSVKSNLIKNGIATTFLRLTGVIEQLLLVPFFINAWGTAFYGEWLTITIVPTILAYSNFGIGTAAGNIFVLKYAADDFKGSADVARTGFLMILTTLFSSILIGGLFLLVLNFYNVFDHSVIPKFDAIWALSLLMIARIIDFFQQLNESYYRAARKAALSINLQSLYSFSKILASLAVLLSGGGIIAFGAAHFICAIVFNLTYGIYGWTLVSPALEVGTANKHDLKEISNKGLGYLLMPVWQSIYFQGGTFVVRIILGPEAVVLFNTVRTATRSINQIFNLIEGSIFPEMQFAIGSKDFRTARKIYIGSICIVCAVALAGITALSLLGLWIYGLWTNHTLHPSNLMWGIFIIGIGFNALWWTSGTVFKAFNKPYSLSVVALISSVLSVLFSYLLSRIYGIEGAAFGYLILDILMALYVVPTSAKLLRVDIRSLPREMLHFYMESYRKVQTLIFRRVKIQR